MTTTISLRLPEDLVEELENVSSHTDRSKSYLVKKAIVRFLEDYADHQIALDRLHDPHDKIISSKELRDQLGS